MHKIQSRITRRALELLGLQYNARLLDLGCGTGISTSVLEEAHRVVGIDVSMHMVRKAQEKGLSVMQAEALMLPFKNEIFNAILSISALQWVSDHKSLVKELARVLKPKGKLVIQFYPETKTEFESMIKALRKHFKGYVVYDKGRSSIPILS